MNNSYLHINEAYSGTLTKKITIKYILEVVIPSKYKF